MRSLNNGPDFGRFFARHPRLTLALIFAVYAFVSTADYQDARASECARFNKSYDKEQDQCR